MTLTTKKDISGMRFSRLIAIKFFPDNSKYAKFLFRCDCGKELVIMAQSVSNGNTQSCGCLHKEKTSLANLKHGQGGINRTRTYNSWASMMDRGVWGGHPSYANYGAIGLGVEDSWHDFNNFYKDMGDRPDGTSIDRIDNKKGYSKENCRWATRQEQALNMEKTIKVLIGGKIEIVFYLCKKLGISHKALGARAYRRGKDYVKALRSFGVDCDYV